MGRPSDFTQDTADAICSRLTEGESLRSICRDDQMPGSSTVFQWLAKHQSFAEQYARAVDARTDAMAEEILQISDDGRNDTFEDESGHESTNHDVIARSRLRVDTRKWLMARMAPKKYGDRVVQQVEGPNGGPVQIQRIELIGVRSDKDT